MLRVYTLEQNEEWDAIVSTFKEYDVYWLSGYVKAFKIHGDGEPLLFYYEKKAVRGINVVMKRDIAHDLHFVGKIEENKYFDFATPYGYGGWIIEGDEAAELFDEYENWCMTNNIISEFVRFHPIVKNHVICESNYRVIKLGEVVRMDLDSKDVIWGNITSKNRNVIRKAVKNGVKIYNGRYPEIYNKFREIYDKTMDKDNADAYYYFSPKFYESVLNDLDENAQVFYAENADREIIAASIILFANEKMNYHLSGSLREYSNLASTNLLLYKAALWGCANGYKTLYLGGGVGSGEDSLLKFKKAFYRNELERFYIGKKIFNEEEYQKLVGIRTDIVNDTFFPKYRA